MKALKQSNIFAYSLGDLGMNLNFQLIGFYLAYFYTDVFGISAVHVAGLFLAARICDFMGSPIWVALHTDGVDFPSHAVYFLYRSGAFGVTVFTCCVYFQYVFVFVC